MPLHPLVLKRHWHLQWKPVCSSTEKELSKWLIDKPIINDSVSFTSLDDLNLVAASNKSYIKINHFKYTQISINEKI